MTLLKAQQIKAHLTLTSAYFWVAGDNKEAGRVILKARGELAVDMDSETLLAAMDLSTAFDYFGRAA